MFEKWTASKSISCAGFALGAILLPTPIEAFAQAAAVRALAVNRDAYVGWVALSKAKLRSIRRFSPAASARLLEPFANMIRAEYGGEIGKFQFRYHLGRQAYVIRGERTGSAIEAYLYRDGEMDFSEWFSVPSALTGPFVALPRSDVDRLSDEHQKHFERLFGRNVMLEDMQIEFTGSLYLIVGVMKWKPPKTHLHSVIVIKLEE